MTRILDRYVGRQIMISATFAVIIILTILILGNVFKDILREISKRPDLSLVFVFKFMALIIPFALGLAIPFSYLSAVLLTFGKLSADSELTSMRMAGLSMSRICLPVAIISVFFTILCGWINLSLTPWAKNELEGMKNTLINMAKRDPMMLIQDQQVMVDFPGYFIHTHKDGDVLRNFQMVQTELGKLQMIALAGTAKLRVDFETNYLMIELDKANLISMNADGSVQPAFIEGGETGIQLSQLGATDHVVHPENLGFFDLFERVTGKNISPWKSETDLRNALREPPKTEAEERDRLVLQSRLKTELSMRFAFSVSCITFALIGVPLGITAQRRETSAGFVLSMVIAIVYYVLLNTAKLQENNPEMYPEYLVWVANLIFMVLGAILFARLSRK